MTQDVSITTACIFAESSTAQQPAGQGRRLPVNRAEARAPPGQGTELCFVNLTAPTQAKNRQNRKIVRTHVMKDFNRKQKQRRSIEDAVPPVSIPPEQLHRLTTIQNYPRGFCRCASSQRRSITNYEHGTRSLASVSICRICEGYIATGDPQTADEDRLNASGAVRRISTASPVSILGAGLVDPFETYPIPVKPYMHRMLHLYDAHTTRRIAGGRSGLGGKSDDQNHHNRVSTLLKRETMAPAIHDVALFHMLMVYAFDPQQLADDVYMRECVIHHKSEAIRTLQSSIMTADQGVSDATLLAVAMLINVEAVFCDPRTTKMHHNGLKLLVEARGGWSTIRDGSLLQRMINWQDLIHALTTGANLCFPAPTSPAAKEFLTIPNSGPRICPQVSLSPGFVPASEFGILDRKLLDIVIRLGSLVTFLNSDDFLRDPENDQWMYNELDVISIELFSLPKSVLPGVATGFGAIQECCRLASTIFVQFLCGVPESVGLFCQRPVAQLRAEIEKTDKESCWEPFSDFFLWVTFIGGVISLGSPLQVWYAAMARKICQHLGIRHWEDARQFLYSFIWSDRYSSYEKACRRFWAVIEMREEESEVEQDAYAPSSWPAISARLSPGLSPAVSIGQSSRSSYIED